MDEQYLELPTEWGTLIFKKGHDLVPDPQLPTSCDPGCWCRDCVIYQSIQKYREWDYVAIQWQPYSDP
jgi:hypothetical protein